MNIESRKKMLLSLVILAFVCSSMFYVYFKNRFACIDIRSSSENRHTLLVQGICQSSLLATINDSLDKRIDKIVKEELKVHGVAINAESAVQAAEYENYHFFLPKERQRLTLYYINDSDNDYLTTISQELEKLVRKNQKSFLIQQATITSDLRFFGDKGDELVSIINDPKKELLFLHTVAKDCMHALSEKYKELYNIQKSEQFAYLPHIGLGRVRSSTIKKLLAERKDAQNSNTVFEYIMERIRKEAIAVAQEALRKHSSSIHFDSISILDLQSKKYILKIILPMHE